MPPACHHVSYTLISPLLHCIEKACLERGKPPYKTFSSQTGTSLPQHFWEEGREEEGSAQGMAQPPPTYNVFSRDSHLPPCLPPCNTSHISGWNLLTFIYLPREVTHCVCLRHCTHRHGLLQLAFLPHYWHVLFALKRLKHS